VKAYIHPASPNCVAVLALVGELNLEMETETVDLFAHANLEPGFLTINPNGLVPVLDDDGFVLWETTAILQYLAVQYGPALLRIQDERARADVTRWQIWGVAHWQPALQAFIFENLFKRLRGLGSADANVIDDATPREERLNPERGTSKTRVAVRRPVYRGRSHGWRIPRLCRGG
jgi:glutathione S-transferase